MRQSSPISKSILPLRARLAQLRKIHGGHGPEDCYEFAKIALAGDFANLNSTAKEVFELEVRSGYDIIPSLEDPLWPECDEMWLEWAIPDEFRQRILIAGKEVQWPEDIVHSFSRWTHIGTVVVRNDNRSLLTLSDPEEASDLRSSIKWTTDRLVTFRCCVATADEIRLLPQVVHIPIQGEKRADMDLRIQSMSETDCSDAERLGGMDFLIRPAAIWIAQTADTKARDAAYASN